MLWSENKFRSALWPEALLTFFFFVKGQDKKGISGILLGPKQAGCALAIYEKLVLSEKASHPMQGYEMYKQ